MSEFIDLEAHRTKGVRIVQQIGGIIRTIALEAHAIPKRADVVDQYKEITGKKISDSSIQYLTERFGIGNGVHWTNLTARFGVHSAVIIDDVVYSDTYGETLETDLAPPQTEHAAPSSIENMPTSELIGLMGQIAVMLQQRAEQIGVILPPSSPQE